MEVIFTDNENHQASGTARAGKLRLIIVLLFVLVFCGGNGAGILIAFFLWKKTARVGLAVAVLVAITVFAFAVAMFLVHVILEGVAADARAAQAQNAEASSEVDTQMKGSEK